MYFETFEKLKRYAALFPDRIDTLTEEDFRQFELSEDKSECTETQKKQRNIA